jgi:hypothetical protein
MGNPNSLELYKAQTLERKHHFHPNNIFCDPQMMGITSKWVFFLTPKPQKLTKLLSYKSWYFACL